MGEISKMFVSIGANTSGLSSGLSGAGGLLAKFAGQVPGVGNKLALAFAAGTVAVGAFAIAARKDIKGGINEIRTGTGATGEALDGLSESMRNIGSTTPGSFKQIGTAVADLNTRLGLTGKPLEDMTTQMMNLSKVTGEELEPLIRSTTRTFGDWGIAAKDQGASLDYLYKVSQSTGIGVGELSDKMTKAGVPLRQLGYDFETSAAMVGKWEKEGVNVDMLLASLNRSAVKLAKGGVPDMNAAWDEMIAKVKGATTETEAITIATEYFGAKASSNMAGAIREGRLEVDALKQSLAGSSDTINKAAGDTRSISEKFQILKQNAYLLVEPLGGALLSAFSGLLSKLMPVAQWISKTARAMSDGQGAFTIVKPVIIGLTGALVAFKASLLLEGAISGISGMLGRLTGAVTGTTAATTAATATTASMGTAAGRAAGNFSSMATATSNAGTQAATTGSKIGGMAGPISMGIAAAVGLGTAIYSVYKREQEQEEQTRKNITAASEHTGELNKLRDATNNLQQGTAEYTAALEAQKQKAQEVVEKAGDLYAVYDSSGQIIDARTDLIDTLANSYAEVNEKTKDLIESEAEASAKVLESTTVHQGNTVELDKRKQKLDELTAKMQEKVALGQSLTMQEVKQLEEAKIAYATAASSCATSLDQMKTGVDDFGKKITGPTGLSAMTTQDVQALMGMLSASTPEVRNLGMTMIQQIIDAEKVQHPAIAGEMQGIMDSVKGQIQAMPAGEVTAAKIGEIIQAEINARPGMTAEMQLAMAQMAYAISGADLNTPMTLVLNGVTQTISATVAEWQAVVNRFLNALGGGTGGGTGGGADGDPATPMATGGIVTRPTYALIGEAGPEAVVPLSGPHAPDMGGTRISIDNVNLPNVQNATDFVKELSDIARKGNHLGRLMKKGIS